MAKGDKKGDQPSQPITTDSRFKSVHNDPRFRLPNLKKFKVKVDERFSKKELEKLSVGASGKKAKIDRYGRKINKKDESAGLDKFYEHESEEEVEEEEEEGSEGDDESVSSDEGEEKEEQSESEEEEDDDELKALTKKLKEEEAEFDRARGEGLGSSSSDSESESEASSSDSSVNFEESDEEESEIELEDGKPEETEPTTSFAVVNMDWDNIRAVDLMATFISFVPKGGQIKSVSIYPSEFGKERMQREEIEGPPKDLFKSSKKNKKQQQEEDSDSDLGSDIDINNPEELEKVTRKLYQEDDGKEDYDSKALRRYQLQRLRYYYAVVKCDSVETARNIYINCDGTEYESTANIFDLRYIPEDMDFSEDDPKDVCNKIPSSYRPDSTFVTDALQHSKVKLTWDETPKERLTLSSRPLSQKEIDENDFKAYLASDSDENDNEEKDSSLKDKYKNLLGDTFGAKGFGRDVGSDDDDVDMEITFDPGLKDENNNEEEEKEEESTIDAYRRKEKERRKRRLAKFKETQAEEKKKVEESKPKDKSGKKNKKKQVPQMDEKSKAELELVLMDEDGEDQKHNPEHFNMKDVIKSEKQKNKKKGKKKKNIDEEMVQDNFVANLNDPRFNEIFESHDYAIDPTSSDFKKTATMKKILQERSNRAKSKPSKKNESKSSKRKIDDVSNSDNVNSLIEKIKKKQRK
ncbi:ESF1 [[Candida] subhashii]|uniref:ESF1 n=1 Tax=[Candida] subhashii TaxID=561895 RepID=A0A8J5QUT9_9ASCO|nr:ESF1 [[Candida] subhashii]KAG7665242.1 ESF1 [[Candida] subhashii]